MRLNSITKETHPLLEGIINLHTLTEATWPQEWTDNIIKDPKFTNWLDTLGISGDIAPPLSGGNVGRAYPIGTKHIVKFTTDRKEADAAIVMKNHNSPHAANIYDVKKIFTRDDPRNPGTNVTLYGIIMQRLNTGVSKKIRAAGNAAYSYLDNNSGHIEDPDAMIKVILAKYLDRRSKHDPTMPMIVSKVVHALYNMQQQTGVLSQDPHGGNMAFKGRDTAFFDLGRSKPNWDHKNAVGKKITALQ